MKQTFHTFLQLGIVLSVVLLSVSSCHKSGNSEVHGLTANATEFIYSEKFGSGVSDEDMELLSNNHAELKKVSINLALEATDVGVSYLGTLQKLEELKLQGIPRITHVGVRHLASCESLSSLLLNGKQIDDGWAYEISKIQSLEKLRIMNDEKITDVGLKHFSSLKRLKSLELWSRNVSDAGLAHLAKMNQLERITLHGSQITDEGLSALINMKNLKSLELHGTKVTRAGEKHFENKVKGCNLSLIGK